jgi:anti-sigma-K factor RskA
MGRCSVTPQRSEAPEAMDYARPGRIDALAAQYAAGTLRGGARRRYETLLAAHPALQAAHRRWQERLMPLAAELPPHTPPERVWRRIEQRLWPAVATLRWWQRVAPWRGMAALASAATLGLAVMLALPGPAQPPVVVVLQGTADTALGVNSFVASVSGDGRALVMRPLLPVSLEPGRVLELWSVPPDGAPRSLGLISAAAATVVSRDKLPATLLRGGTAALAVSLEPPGGSTTGVPTGPVLYTGRLQL